MRCLPPALLLALVVAAPACGDDDGNPSTDGPVDAPTDAPTDAGVIPVLRNPVDLADLPLAQQASALLGVGATENCDTCHTLSRGRLRDWADFTAWTEAACLTDKRPDTQAEALAIVECLRVKPGKPFTAGPVGIYTTAAGLPWFEYVFRLAYGPSAWEAAYDDFKLRVAMPRGGLPAFSQDELDLVAEWFARGLPRLEDVVGEDPPPPPCTGDIQPAVGAHVAAMATDGWRAINRDAHLLMHGCGAATDPRDCLTTYPRASERTWATGWTAVLPASTIRILHTVSYQSSYWTRSSADGRFVSHGGGSSAGATVIDLAQSREIPAHAAFDPGFFPDNSGFVIQGSSRAFCRQSLLTSSPAQITFNEPECSSVSSVGLYQHLGAVRGGDYWTVHGGFAADDGGHGPTGEDPSSWFDSSSSNRLVPMIFNGTSYVGRAAIDVAMPYEGDTVISPSSKLLVSRMGSAEGVHSGFALRALNAVPAGNTYDVTTPTIGHYCVRGGKPGFSYDERWIVYHHYVEAGDWQSLGYGSASDPAFVALRQAGAANLFLLDLTTGVERRITTMGPGQYALFPHFRSDGWIYAIVRDNNRNREDVIASDAALTLE